MEILLSTIVLGAWCGYASSLLGSRVSNKGGTSS